MAAALIASVAAGCAGDGDGNRPSGGSPEPSGPEVLLAFDGASAGDVVGLVADDERRVVSWLHRTDGTVHELAVDDPDATPTVVATVEVGTESVQGGLLDQALLPGGGRIITHTDRRGHLVVAELADEPVVRWDAGEAGNGAIGGRVELLEPGSDTLLLSVGRNVTWSLDGISLGVDTTPSVDTGRSVEEDGALFTAPIDGSALPTLVSFGYTNPWAFEAVGDGELWVWDNAAGSDPEDRDVDDVERFGRADGGDRTGLVRSDRPDRAPSAMIELPDGRLGVCGFLDGELRAYEIVDGPDGERTGLERAGTIMPCDVDAAVFADGTIVTTASADDGASLLVLRP